MFPLVPGFILADAGESGFSREIAVTIVAVLAVSAFWAGLYFWDRRRRPAVVQPGMALFGDLCRSHRLADEDHELLTQVAGRLRNPAVVFVDPEILDRYGIANPEAEPACMALRERLFGL